MSEIPNTQNASQGLPQSGLNSADMLPLSSQKIPKQPLPYRKSVDSFFAALIFGCTFMLIYIGAFGEMALGFTLSVFASYAMLFIFAGLRKISPSPLSFAYAVCSLSLSVCYSLYSNGSLRVAWFVAITGMTSLFLLELCRAQRFPHSSYWSMLDVLRAVFLMPFLHIGDSVRFLFQKQDDSRSGLGKILIGAAISVPVLTILVPILASADAVFQNIIERAFGSISELLLALFLSVLLFFPLWSLLFGLSYLKPANTPQLQKLRRIDPVILCVVLGTMSALYFVYLLAQTAYFFEPFSGIVPEGAGLPSEFARRGFFELCWIAVINALLILPMLALSKRKTDQTLPKALQIISAIICLQTLLLIATAIQKMLLYIDIFGFTRLRIYTSAFMIFLALAWLILLLRLFIVKLPAVPMTAICAAAMLLVLTFGASDVNIVRHNVRLYLDGVTENIDFSEFSFYGSDLSVVTELVKLTKSENEVIKEKAFETLTYAYNDLYVFKSILNEANGEWIPDGMELKSYHVAEGRAWVRDKAKAIVALEAHKDEFLNWATPYFDKNEICYNFPAFVSVYPE